MYSSAVHLASDRSTGREAAQAAIAIKDATMIRLFNGLSCNHIVELAETIRHQYLTKLQAGLYKVDHLEYQREWRQVQAVVTWSDCVPVISVELSKLFSGMREKSSGRSESAAGCS
jgi:hypothetical protein